MEQATGLVRLYEPSSRENGPLLGLLFLAGTAASVSRPTWRVGLALPLTVLTVLVLSAFLDGPVPRFRYPLDPLIALVAAAGLLSLAVGARTLLWHLLYREPLPWPTIASAAAREARPAPPSAGSPRLSVSAPTALGSGSTGPPVDGAGRE
jgi:hypothetical protein